MYACSDSLTATDDEGNLGGGLNRTYGAPVAMGNGLARSYITTDEKNNGAPTEIGVAFDEKAMEGLPMDMGSHGPGHDLGPYAYGAGAARPYGQAPSNALIRAQPFSNCRVRIRSAPQHESQHGARLTPHVAPYAASAAPPPAAHGWLVRPAPLSPKTAKMESTPQRRLLAALRAGGPLPAWTHDAGGPNSPVPGGTSAAVVDLTPGTYALICVIPAADGTPHVMKGMGHTFTVANGADNRTKHNAAATTVTLGTPDVTVDLADYTFSLSRPLSRGHHVIRVRNTAAQSHEMFIARMVPGKKAEDALAWVESPKGPSPLMPLGGTAGLARGAWNDIALDLSSRWALPFPRR